MPYSTEEVRKVCLECKTCCKLKPRFFKKPSVNLVKATAPFDRLNVDFKGPLPSSSRNKYFLTVVDEYSRFPWAFPCSDVSSKSVISCLKQLFSIFGMPKYIHSDRGSAFMSTDVKEFLLSCGVATSRTTIFHAVGNSQCERFNGIIWKSIQLALHSHGLKTSNWEDVLPVALHSIRSLISTATNDSPHDRLFKFPRHTSNGTSLPSWLTTPGPVLLRRYVRSSKYDPYVDEVELLEANDQYAHVKLAGGQERTVSTQDLAPPGTHDTLSSPIPKVITTDDRMDQTPYTIGPHGNEITESSDIVSVETARNQSVTNQTDGIIRTDELNLNDSKSVDTVNQSELRRSTRVRKPPNRLVL